MIVFVVVVARHFCYFTLKPDSVINVIAYMLPFHICEAEQ